MRIDDSGQIRRTVIDAAQSAGQASARRVDLHRDAVPPAELRAWNRTDAAVVPQPTRTDSVTGVTRDSNRVPPDTRTLAALAKDVYNDRAVPPAGWSVASPTDLDRLGIDPRTLENPQSGFRARIYAEGEGADRRYVVTFRGSQSQGDWIANAQQSVGLPSDHYRRALLIGQRLARFEGADVTISGHSLGGGLASAAALASGNRAVTFNAAGLSAATIASATGIRTGAGREAAPQVDAFFVRGEILSALQDGGDRVAGGLLGYWLGGPAGGVAGAALADAPSAYGTRHALDAMHPTGQHWWNDNPVARHGMDWVLASLPAR